MTHSTDLLWLQPSWRSQVDGWIDAILQQRGLLQTGETTQPHIRPWSTVLKIPTSAGDVYFKAVIPDLAYEAALTEALFSWSPQCVPHLLASDPQQGWLLMMDGGMRLRELLKTTDDIQHWEVLLPRYAALQQKSMNHGNELLEMGVSDRRLTQLPAKFEALLNHPTALSLNHQKGLNSDEYAQLRNCVSTVSNLCDQLEFFGLSSTLDHGDLHDGNVFVLDGNYRFFDWGDSGISHPFFSLHRTFRNVQERFDLQADSVWFTRLKVAYLQAWRAHRPQDQLESAFALAQQLAPIPAALRWLPVLNSMNAEARDKYAWAIPELMRELMAAIL